MCDGTLFQIKERLYQAWIALLWEQLGLPRVLEKSVAVVPVLDTLG